MRSMMPAETLSTRRITTRVSRILLSGRFSWLAGQNEHIIGQWMKRRNNRDDIVLATKYTTSTRSRPGVQYDGLPVNYAGNAKKSLKLSVGLSRATELTYRSRSRCASSTPTTSIFSTFTGGTTRRQSRNLCNPSTTSCGPVKSYT